MGCRARKERDKDSSAGGVKGNASSVPQALRRTKPPQPQQASSCLTLAPQSEHIKLLCACNMMTICCQR